MIPFLAYFLEKADQGPVLGTQTGTRANENPDTDEELPKKLVPGTTAEGTQTVTEVGGEHADADIAPELGTQTMTKTANESSDTDLEVEQGSLWQARIL